MAKLRHIAVVTGTRAEYGLLETVIRAIDDHVRLRLSLIVAGTHMISDSLRDISFPMAARVRMQQRGKVGRVDDALALGRGVSGFTKVFAALSPDFVLILGDRVEAFAAASAASVSGVRVAHLHGGDRAEGVADEAMRHAITKLAHLHLAATSESQRRMIRMGEVASTVFKLGSPAVDRVSEIKPASTHDGKPPPRVIVLHHPVGDDDEAECHYMTNILSATRRFPRLVLSPNHDPGRNGILRAITTAKIDCVDHLPRDRFVALLKAADLIVGNSSAGLIEAAVCKTPCVNVGPRQNGREKPNSVIDVPATKHGITKAIKTALSLDHRRFRHPYGKGGTGRRVAELLASLDLDCVPLRKQNAY